MTDSLCRKRKLADSFIPCDFAGIAFAASSSAPSGYEGFLPCMGLKDPFTPHFLS